MTRLRRLGTWSVRAVVAGGLVAIVDFAIASSVAPSAASYLPGALLAIAQLAGLYSLFALPIAWVFALLDVPAVHARLPSAASVAASATLAAAFLVAGLVVTALSTKRDIEFTRELSAMRWLAFSAIVFACVLFLPLVRRGYERLGDKAPRAGELASVVALGLCAVGMLMVSHFVMAPIYQYAGAAVFALAACAFAMAAVRKAGGDIPRRAGIGVVVGVGCFALVGLYLPGPARDHARFVVFVETTPGAALATELRKLFDRDGDGSTSKWLGGTDCDEGNAAVGPGVIEIPGDGIDQDCRGGDAPLPVPPLPPPRGPAGCTKPTRGMSVLFIVIDACRADALSPERTPNLLRLARSSQVFPRAYSPTSMTETSFPSMFAARPLSDTGARNPVVEGFFKFDATITERFRDAGYSTAVFSDLDFNPVVLRGFQKRNPFWHDASIPNVKHDLTTAAYARGVLDYMSATSGSKFVLTHLADVHAPYVLDTDELGHHFGEWGAYMNDVAYVDAQLGIFFAHLKQSGKLDNTVIAITADHGEELFARGLHGHGAGVFDEITRVPLILWVPGCPPHVVKRPVSTVHLGSTLGAITGVHIRGMGLFSRSDLPVVTEGATEATYNFQRGIIVGQYKLIVDVPNGGRMLFDLAKDPGETDNIYASEPTAAAALERAYQRWLDAPGKR